MSRQNRLGRVLYVPVQIQGEDLRVLYNKEQLIPLVLSNFKLR